MKILVTGGSGFVGKPLVKALAAKGQDVIVFGREDDADRPDNVEMITGDIREKGSLRKAMKNTDVVFHLAGCRDEDHPEMWSINVEGTKKVAELCKERKVKQLIFLSFAGVLGSHHNPATENAPQNPKTKYEKSMAAAENIIKHSGVPYTIIRAPLILGPSRHWNAVIRSILKGYPQIGKGKNKLHLIHRDDVIRALISVVGKKSAINQIFHIGSKDVMTYEEIHDFLCKKYKIQKKKRQKHFAHFLLRINWMKNILQNKPVGIEPHHISMMQRSYVLSTAKIKKSIGFEPQYTTLAALQETLKEL